MDVGSPQFSSHHRWFVCGLCVDHCHWRTGMMGWGVWVHSGTQWAGALMLFAC
jgi:hypothetical protein